MKVLHIETGMNLYGGALQVFYLLRGLHEKGVENILVCPRGSEIAAAAAPFAQVAAFPMRGDLDVPFAVRLIRLLRKVKPDIMHVHSRRGADLWGAVAARVTGIRSILTRRVDNPEPRWLAKLKYGQFDRVITISAGIRVVLAAEGVPERQLTCVHSAVDLEPYREAADRDWFRREFGLGGEEQTVAVIAQLIPRKGHRFLIEAAPAILHACPETRFLFFGKGPLRDELEQLCAATGIAGKVIFAGFRDDLQRILPCLDVVVHPALMEGLGVSLLQAAACGLPIVAARAGGIPEIVRNGINGYLVQPGDSDALVGPVVELLRKPGTARRMGEAGLAIVKSDFSIPAMIGRNLEIYSSLGDPA